MENKQNFDPFLLTKIAFQVGYPEVYVNECSNIDGEKAIPDKWITDETKLLDFAFDNGFEVTETEAGDIFTLEGAELEDFLTSFEYEIQRANQMTVNELLLGKQNSH